MTKTRISFQHCFKLTWHVLSLFHHANIVVVVVVVVIIIIVFRGLLNSLETTETMAFVTELKNSTESEQAIRVLREEISRQVRQCDQVGDCNVLCRQSTPLCSSNHSSGPKLSTNLGNRKTYQKSNLQEHTQSSSNLHTPSTSTSQGIPTCCRVDVRSCDWSIKPAFREKGVFYPGRDK